MDGETDYATMYCTVFNYDGSADCPDGSDERESHDAHTRDVTRSLGDVMITQCAHCAHVFIRSHTSALCTGMLDATQVALHGWRTDFELFLFHIDSYAFLVHCTVPESFEI